MSGGVLPGVRLVDHKADYRALIDKGLLVTPDYTFYRQPVAWWRERFNGPVYLEAIAPRLIAIRRTPELGVMIDDGGGVRRMEHRIDCSPDRIILSIAWFTPTVPTRDLSVFVHLLDADGTLMAQADQSAPIYGWSPLTTWLAGEIVRDIHALPRLEGGIRLRYGLYTTTDAGFENVIVYEEAIQCNS